jgi:hypothetical protein
MNLIHFSRLRTFIKNVRRRYRHLPRKERMNLSIEFVNNDCFVRNIRTKSLVDRLHYYGCSSSFTVSMLEEK